ncbi:ChaB family protein [Mesobacillus jeotgali]|uniref:ChaB family protein n=1 Tax=Mesobacillus jeotgali TaxID=129985 RepID=UPI0009A8951A|nr:ChaB family protein [Mesobacillus jeotgali]
MPYDTLKDLPDAVKDNLPHHAQEIFKEAFNSASEQYKDEETAFKVAWSAVKNDYEKNEQGDWVRKEED